MREGVGVREGVRVREGVGGGGGTVHGAEVEAAEDGGNSLLLLTEDGMAMVSLKETMGFETMRETPAKRS